LVTATVTSFGRDNKYAGRPGFDFLAQAMGGLMSVTGQPDGEPTRVGVAIADVNSGLYLAQGVLAALLERERTGGGGHVEVSLLDVQVAMLVNLASAWLNADHQTERFGNAHPSIAPYETFNASDGVIALAIGTNPQFRRLATTVRLPELADDPRFTTNAARVQNRDPLGALLADQLRRRTVAEWLEALVESDVPVAPVNGLKEVFTDPVVRARMVAEIEGVQQVLSPLRLNDEQPQPASPPPRLGHHTQDSLTQLGLSADDIAGLQRNGVV
jgi:crotonobetainyl-CoA:carnitine CoA-transferase CaiB-like acyl-CoA transferase